LKSFISKSDKFYRFLRLRFLISFFLVACMLFCVDIPLSAQNNPNQPQQNNPNRNIFGNDLGQFGKDAFGGLFGIKDSKDKKSINQPTPGNWTKSRARTMQGGADPTGFWAPPPISDFRSDGIHKDRPSTGNEILKFWITVPGEATVGQSFDYGPFADYGAVEKAMVWDVNGYVMGGYTKTAREKVKIGERHKLVIEKWDPELGVWNKISERDSTSGTAGFQEQGYYRLTVALYHTAFRLAPQYGTVRVTDPKFNRKSSEIYYEVDVKLPSPYYGVGMTISGHGKTQQYRGDTLGWRPDCGTYEVRAMAKRGVVDFEDSGSRSMKSSSQPEYYKNASWVLRGKDSAILWKNDQRESFLFDANHWGDGQYTLETHLAKEHQGQGVQNMTVKPAITYITVNECGKGAYKPPQDEQKTFEGDKQAKETINIPDIDVNKFAQLDGKNMKVIPQMPLFKVINQNLPKDTPNPPADICRDCPKLQRQISQRTRQLQIMCDEPGNLMEQMLKAPKRYDDMEKTLAKEWEALLVKVQSIRNPFTKLAGEYLNLILTAYREGLVVSAEDQRQYRPMDNKGNPSVIGQGIPIGYCIFDKKKVDLANRLRAEQKRIYGEWAKLRLDTERRFPELQKEIEAANQRFDDYFRALLEMRADLGKMQSKLSGMYYSGKYEHCLGGGGQKTSGDYTIVQADGKKDQGAAWGLPGMNVQLPEAKKKKIDPAIVKAPKPLHEIQPLMIKWDGIKQAEMDRKLMESLANARRLQYEAEYGSWTNWVGSKLVWLNEMAVGLAKYNPATAPIGYVSDFIKSINSGMSVEQALQQTQDSYGAASDMAQKAGNLAYDAIFKKDFRETMKDIDNAGKFMIELVPNIFEGLADDVVKVIRAKTDILKSIEQDMDELNELYKYGDTPDANRKRTEIYKRQMENYVKLEEAGKAADNLILTAATSNTALGFSKFAGGKTDAAIKGIQNFLKKGMEEAAIVGEAVGKTNALGAKAANAEKALNEGFIPENSGKTKGAIDKLKDASKADNGVLEASSKSQEEAAKKLAKELDDKVKIDQEKIDKLTPRGNWEPKEANFNQQQFGEKVGAGNTATIKNTGEGKVAKVFDRFSDPDNPEKIFSLEDFTPGSGKKLSEKKLQEVLGNAAEKQKGEADGIKAMKEKGVPHVETTGKGSTRMQVMTENGVKEVDVPTLEKIKFAPNQETVEDIIKKRGLTRQEQIEALQFFKKAADEGIVFLDPNPGNLVKETLPDGKFRFIATEGGSVYNAGNPELARKIMAEMFRKPGPGITTNYERLLDLSERFEKAGGEKALALLGKAENDGISFSNKNLGKVFGDDLSKDFADPSTFEKTVNDSRRARALSDNLNDPKIKTGLKGVKQTKKKFVEDCKEVLRKTETIEKEVELPFSLPTPAPLAIQFEVQLKRLVKDQAKDGLGEFFNDSFFEPVGGSGKVGE